MEEYLERSTFLADANNELGERNASYADNLKQLENLVLVVFAKDVTVVPKESAWFSSEAAPSESKSLYAMEGAQRPMVKDEPVTLIPMREQPLYKEDWIGLRTLDEAGKVHFASCDGPHMHISDECWRPLAEKYFGGVLDS
jgi:palmitoyl-protein thioesterase